LRAAILAHLADEVRRNYHESLARSLSQRDCRDPEALAHHWLKARAPEHARRWFLVAASRAEQAHAFRHAAELYRAALAITADVGDGERRELLHKSAAALANSGRPVDAAEAFVAAAHGAPPAEARERRRLAAEHLLRAGRIERGIEIAHELLREVGVHLPTSSALALTSLFWQRARVRLRGLTFVEKYGAELSPERAAACDILWSIASALGVMAPIRAAELHTRGVQLALDLGDPTRVARALAFEGLYSEDSLRARGALATAEIVARRVSDPYLLAYIKMCWGMHHLGAGEPAHAAADAEAALALFRESPRHVVWETSNTELLVLLAHSYLGRFAGLRQRFESTKAEAEQRGNLYAVTALTAMNRCLLDLAEDRPDDCEAELERVMASWPREMYLQHAFALASQVLVDVYRGSSRGHLRIEAAWRKLKWSLILRNTRLRVFFVFTRAVAALASLAAERQNSDARVALVENCARRLAREIVPDAAGGAHLLRGQLAHFRGQHAEARRHYRTAAGAWEPLGMYGARVASQRLAEMTDGHERLTRTRNNEAWAAAQGVVNLQRFFAATAPIL
jgi:tetratricopeptide (TPR) repeat protein